ncbi:MAG: hypothetical protein QI223_07650 [Candidatus Korarchaeota archaeon]|nr:hypothetical protein [Candidatus Korarchaeota archaeon]
MRARTVLAASAIAVELAAVILLVLFIDAAIATLSNVAESGIRAERKDGVLQVHVPARNGGFVPVDVAASVEIRVDGQISSADEAIESVPPGKSTVLDLRLPIPGGPDQAEAELNLRIEIEAFHGLLGMEVSGRFGGG